MSSHNIYDPRWVDMFPASLKDGEMSDLLGALIDSAPSLSPFWQRIYEIGDELAARGESMSEQLQIMLRAFSPEITPWDQLDREIYFLYNLASYEAELQQLELRELEAICPEPDGREMQMLTVSSLQAKASSLRATISLFGDRRAVEVEAKTSGFAREVHEAIDDIEADIGHMTEQLEELQPQYDSALADFHLRLERGEIYEDPLIGWVDSNHLRNVGERTRVSDISTAVASRDEIAGETCPICLEEFASLAQVVRLPCSHLVDAVCLDTWVNGLAERCNACMLCRRELFPRRAREPSQYMHQFTALGQQYNVLKIQIGYSRRYVEALVEILQGIAPGLVAQSLGH